jgi:hypothetical protein
MMRVPQLRESLQQLGSHGSEKSRIADVAKAWVTGVSIEAIARQYFLAPDDPDITGALTKTCRAIYRHLAMAGSWGIAGLAKLPTSGIAFADLSPEQRRGIGMLPAMLYHGVATESAVLMRMSGVPRSIAPRLGVAFDATNAAIGTPAEPSSQRARAFLDSLSDGDWERLRPPAAAMSGADYRAVWRTLNGIG